MRIFLSLLVGMNAVVGCNSAEAVSLSDDDRYDLSRFVLSPMLVEDIETCVERSEFIKLADGDYSADTQAYVDRAGQFWLHVDAKLNAYYGIGNVASFGEVSNQLENVPSSIFSIESSSAEKNEKCGEVAGEAVTAMGFASLSEIMSVVAEMSPELRANSDLSPEKVKKFMFLMAERISHLEQRTNDEVVDCVALSQIDRMLDISFKPYADLWIYTLHARIEKKSIAENEISDFGEYWKMLDEKGVKYTAEFVGVTAARQNCLMEANAAIRAVTGT